MAIQAASLIVHVGGDVSEAQSALNQASKSVDNFAKKAGQSMTGVGAAMTAGISLPLFKIGKDILSVGAQYESAMHMFQAVSGATADEMKRASDLAEELGADLTLPATSAADATTAMVELAKAGLSVNDTFGAAKGVLQLSAAGNLSNAAAAEIAANALNAFNLAGSEATRIADMFAAAANASSAEVFDIADAFKMAAAVFSSAGQSVDSLTTAIGLMANAGIQGSDAGTSLKQMLLSLMAPTDKSRTLMEGLGITVYDLSGNMLPLPEIIGNFNAAMAHLTQEQRNAALATIFGSDAIRAANILLSEGVDGWNAMETAVNRGGAAADLAGARMKGLGGAVEGLKSQVETAYIAIYKQISPAIEDAVRQLAEFVPKVQDVVLALFDLPTAIQAGVLGFIGMAAVVGPLLVALGGLLIVLGSVGAPILAVAAALTTLGAVAAVVVVEWDRINALFPEVGEVAALVADAFVILGDVVLAVLPAIAVGVESVITLILGNLKMLLSGLLGTGKMVAEVAGGIKQTFEDIRSGDFSLDKLKSNFSGAGDVFEETSQRLQDASKMMMGAFDPILSPRKFMEGMDEWRERLDGLVDGFGKGTTSATEFGEALDQVGQQSGFESTGMEEFIASMQAGEQAVANLAAGIDAVHVINLSWNNSVAEASAHVSHWEGMLSSAESALDILNKQVESGIPLNEEQQKQYDALTWATGRYAGGVADQQQAFVDAEAQRAIYNQGLDDLNQQLKDGALNQEQYAQAAADLAEGIDPAIVSQENMRSATETLYGHIEDLVGAVHDLMVGLGLIPDDVTTEITADTTSATESIDGLVKKTEELKPEPIEFAANTDAAVRAVSEMNQGFIETVAKPITIEVDTLAAMNSANEVQARVDEIAQAEPIKVTADITEGLQSVDDMQTAVDEITQTTPIPIDADNLAAMNSAHEVQAGIDGIVQGALPTIDADNSPALGSISTVQSSLNGLTDHTITIYANIAPFEAGIQTARNQLPSSPAKEGPFSKEPDWAWVFEGMPDAAARASSRATEIASAIITGMSADTSRIGELAGFVDDRVAIELSRQYQELGDDLQDAILSGADEETRAKLQSELDAAGALLARWSEETGRTIEQLIGIATDERNLIEAQDALQELFSTISGRTQDIISGGYISELEGQLRDLRQELILLEGIDAPEIVLQGVRDQIGQTTRELELAGRIYGEAVRRGIVAAFDEDQREAGFWSFLVDSLDELASGGLVERLTQDVADLQRDIAILSLAGAPQAIIDELTAELASKEDQLARIGGIIQDGIAAGIIEDPNATTPISEAILSQLRAMGPTLANQGAELSKPLTDAFLSGRLSADQFLSMFPVDILRDTVLPELERLEDALTVDLVKAMLNGGEGADLLNEKLRLLAELLGLIKREAQAVTFNDGFLITGPGAGEVGSQGQGQRPRYGPQAAGYVSPNASNDWAQGATDAEQMSYAGAQQGGPSTLVNNIYLPSGELLYSELVNILNDQKGRVLT